MKWLLGISLALALSGVWTASGQDDMKQQLADLRKEVEALRRERATPQPVAAAKADAIVENKYGPNADVRTKEGRLTIGGLVQVWYYSLQNDNHAWVDGQGGHYGNNEVADNDGFRIRRARLWFDVAVHENVSARIMINPANEITSFPSFPSNQWPYTNAGFNSSGGAIGNTKNDAVRNGSAAAGRMLEEAWVNYHGVVPHHDFTIGQMFRRIGEEGPRPSSQLDFAERAMINQYPSPFCDLGLQAHGTWFDDRLQYWLGVFNHAGSAFQPTWNRADDNDDKDYLATVLGRPIWRDETWGSLELGYSLCYGRGGEGDGFGDGLNFRQTVHVNQHIWAYYAPGGPAKGLWLRGEWAQYRDRFRSGNVVSYPDGSVIIPKPFNIQGWYAAAGYKLADSRFKDDLPKWLKPIEPVVRYEVMENLFCADPSNHMREADAFKTQVWTAGVNYYIKGHNAKVQVNYNWVIEEDNVDAAERQVREVRNNNLIVNFQVSW